MKLSFVSCHAACGLPGTSQSPSMLAAAPSRHFSAAYRHRSFLTRSTCPDSAQNAESPCLLHGSGSCSALRRAPAQSMGPQPGPCRRVLCKSSSKAGSSSSSTNSSSPNSDSSISSLSEAADEHGAAGSSMQDSSSPTSGTPAHEAGSPAAAAAAGADADVEEDELEDECEEESEEDSQEEGDGSFVPTTDIDARMEAMLAENTFNGAVLELAASMAAVGFQGTAALGLGYLLTQRSLLDSFRWNVADVETGLLWVLPCITLSILITALPLPSHKDMMNSTMAAAAAAAGGGSSSSWAGGGSKSLDAFTDARRMATINSLVSDIPVKVTIGGDDDSSEQQLLTPFSAAAAQQALRYMQEYVAEPFSTKTNSAKTWGVRIVGGLLRRLSVELFWRGLIVAGLAGWLYSTWETAGTSQDSPLFYARLFGLLTPQASLAAISLILAATRIPADLARTQPAVTYARLASMEVEVVGRLTEDDWLVLVIPAEAAAAAAATAPNRQQQRNRKLKRDDVTDSESFNADLQDALSDKVQSFGRMKAANRGSSSSSSSGAAAGQQPQLSRQEMEQQLEKLLTAVQDWKRKYGIASSSSSSSSSSGRSGSTDASKPLQPGFELTAREQEAAELAAECLELVKASAAAKAAAAVATKSKYIAKSAGLPSSKLGTGLETLLRSVNDDPQRRLFLLHIGTDASSSSSSSSTSSSDGDSDEDESSSDDEDDSSRPGSVQAMLRAKARTAAEGARQDESSRRAVADRRDDSSKAVGQDESSTVSLQQELEEAVGNLKDGLLRRQQKQKQRQTDKGAGDKQRSAAAAGGAGADASSSKSSGSDSDSDGEGETDEGLTYRELEGLLMKQMQQLATREGQNTDLALYLKASKGSYRVAANIPTAQDRIAAALLVSFALLEQLAVAGAFVASSGNLAASFSAAAALQVATVTLQQVVGQRERRRVREAMGSGWALQLQMLGL